METTQQKNQNSTTEKENTNGTTHSPLHEYGHKGKKAMNDRVAQLEQEWDVDRTLLLNAAVISVSGALLGAFVNKKWFLLTAVAALVMAEQAITGWSPATGLMKKLGKRTKEEIARERYGLKAMKGDFKNTESVDKVWDATQ